MRSPRSFLAWMVWIVTLRSGAPEDDPRIEVMLMLPPVPFRIADTACTTSLIVIPGGGIQQESSGRQEFCVYIEKMDDVRTVPEFQLRSTVLVIANYF